MPAIAGALRGRALQLQWRVVCSLLAAACCQALLPVRVDSFSLAPPRPRPGTASGGPCALTADLMGRARFGLRLRGGERTPPPGHAGASMRACAGGDGAAAADSNRPQLFAVEGLIGAGKSTLLAKLRSEQVPPHTCARAHQGVSPRHTRERAGLDGAARTCMLAPAHAHPHRPAVLHSHRHGPQRIPTGDAHYPRAAREVARDRSFAVRCAPVCVCMCVYVCV